MTLVTVEAWAGDPATWDALKACDVVFCCTDDHVGRLFLNRFARFYGIPIIDVGLAVQRRSHTVYDLFARVSTLVPGHPCLLCGGYIDPRKAREEALKRDDPDAYQRLKDEAYVLGEGNPSPAVVTFTTEAATMAVNEWLTGITGFAGQDGMVPTRMRRFHARDERRPFIEPRRDCLCCAQLETLGRADMRPFLDMVS
ncbi:MAG: ThiF family adenylyltransferase, partial [Rhodospirillaceae bacterium]|nr:ThiF family adenylyltransferase [Rhodospirillaceae bacterium]